LGQTRVAIRPIHARIEALPSQTLIIP